MSGEARSLAYGNQFAGAVVEPSHLYDGDPRKSWWWSAWHGVEAASGLSDGLVDAILACDHLLDGRRSAGQVVERLAETYEDAGR